MTSPTTWNPERYDKEHHFVSDYGRQLIDLLDPKPSERILDLGCGTGALAHEISKRGAFVIGIDSSPEMIEQAKKNYPDLVFEMADGHDFHFDTPFDAVFSNAALHWMKAPEKVIACIAACLTPHGRFVFEMGGKNNLQQVLAAIEQAALFFNIQHLPLENYFPSLEEYSNLLKNKGFHVVFMETYERPTVLQGEEGLQNWVRMFRSSVLQKIDEREHETFFKIVEKNAKEKLYRDSVWRADYVRLRGVAVKSS